MRLPGTFQGLLRKGSPVHIDLPAGKITGVVVLPGYIAFRNGGMSDVWSYGPLPGEPSMTMSPTCFAVEVDVPISNVYLDFDDALGKTHAAWWLAEQYGLACPVVWGYADEDRFILFNAEQWGIYFCWAQDEYEYNLQHKGNVFSGVHEVVLLPSIEGVSADEALHRACLHAAEKP